ncbi:MAG: hypothetical protein FWF49_00015 [Oscillospiraceae bacterium]|nr:hypothetical protein [Oscillospiraceae bacterium]
MRKKRVRKRVLIPALIVAGVFLAAVTAGALWFTGLWVPDAPAFPAYPVRGVDVSSYQGDINWKTVKAQHISFAFIKATEGSNSTDAYFQQNYTGAAAAGLRVGAYHFFSFESGGDTQAAHFIDVVPKTSNMLPPVIDLEFYGEYIYHPQPRGQVVAQLKLFVEKIQGAYGMTPIFYATASAYARYLQNDFVECDVWIRNTLAEPSLPGGRAWTFWQYTDKGRLRGFSGSQRYVDLNVFCGTAAEFAQYPG